MAKAKTKKAAKSITAAELKEVQDVQTTLNQVIYNIGAAEIATQKLHEAHTSANAKFQEVTAKLQKKYGEVNVDLSTGNITPIEA